MMDFGIANYNEVATYRHQADRCTAKDATSDECCPEHYIFTGGVVIEVSEAVKIKMSRTATVSI